MRIELHPRFVKRIRKCGAGEREKIAQALRGLVDGFGHPHLHSGLGIRRLRKDLFECRAGIGLRVLFFAEKGVLTAYDVMTHGEIKAWLKSF